jgi:DNA-binding transcriptional LysR family regulator
LVNRLIDNMLLFNFTIRYSASMLDQLRQIAIFAKTVEHGSFRKAAAALHLSPSVVSHHIAKLEQQLGVALLYRSTRKLSLTSDGEQLLDSAHSMISAAEDFFSMVSKHAPKLLGELKITLPAVMERSTLVNDIGDFAKSHPDVSVQLDFTDIRREMIEDGVDLAIRMGWLRDSSLKARKLYEVNRRVVASAIYFKAKPTPVTIKDVESWDWIELSPVGFNAVFNFPKDSARLFRPKSRIRVSSAHAIAQLVAHGNGVAALPEFLTDKEIANGKLVHVLPNLKIKPIGVYAVWPPNAPKGGLTNRLVEFLVKKVSATQQ